MPYQLLNRLCSATLPEVIGAQPEIEKLRFLKAQGLVEATMKPADFAAQIRTETATWAGIIKARNITAE